MGQLRIPEEVPTLGPEQYEIWRAGVDFRSELLDREHAAQLTEQERVAAIQRTHDSVVFAMSHLRYCEAPEDYGILLGDVATNGLPIDPAIDVYAQHRSRVVPKIPMHPLNKLGSRLDQRTKGILLFSCFSTDNGFTYQQEEEIIAAAGAERQVGRIISDMRFALFTSRALLSAVSFRSWLTNQEKKKISDFYPEQKERIADTAGRLASAHMSHLSYSAIRAKRKATRG